jgi:D-lactate dehydrogenase
VEIAFFSSKGYDRTFFEKANQGFEHELKFFEARLNRQTVPLAQGSQAVCCFVNDELNRNVLEALAENGCKYIALRCAGFNNLDVQACRDLGLRAVRVPAYSPYAVAEHAVGLLLTLNRKIHRALSRVRELNFSLEGLIGFDLHGAIVGVVGTGKIGRVMISILKGFGCRVLAFDPYPASGLDVEYVTLEELLKSSRIVTLHCPLTSDSYHLIDEQALKLMQPNALLVNTSRGALVDTTAVIKALKQKRLGGLAIDVYEEEEELFFEDQSTEVLQDDVFARLLTFPNVVVTGHQAFLTAEALGNIAETTLNNLAALDEGESCPNEIAFS